MKNSDIAGVHVGNKVKFNVAALPSTQYGFAEGTISKIYGDTIIQQGNNTGYYLAECSLNVDGLTDSNGNFGRIMMGMQVEAKIIVQRKTIMRFVLEKLNFWS